MKIGLKKSAQQKVLHGVPFSLETPSPPPPPPSSLERIIYNPANFAYKSFRSSPSSFYIHIYFFSDFFVVLRCDEKFCTLRGVGDF